MPTLTRPDGATIHWEPRGEGPPLYAAHNAMVGMPSTFATLLDDLARDHQVVTWDPRGAGQSSRDGRYDFDTDADDLAALLEHVGPGVLMALGFSPAPLGVAERRPDSVAGVVIVGGPVPVRPNDDAESLIDSESVGTAVRQMAQSEPRALLRSFITLGNPQLSETEVHERLEAQLVYCPIDAWTARMDSYLGRDMEVACTALGDRLWIVQWPNPLRPENSLERLRAVLPRAQIVETEDGPISRPDLIAAVVRKVTAAAACT